MTKKRSTFRKRKLSRERRLQERESRRLENNLVVGHARESYVAHVLQYAVAQKAILAASVTEPWSNEDLSGWDVIISDLQGQIHRLQVKGSEELALGFLKRHPDIPIVTVKLTDSPVQVFDKVLQALPQIPELKRVAIPS